jgi:pimeloyl-ACP methyl ester carboxylesterase
MMMSCAQNGSEDTMAAPIQSTRPGATMRLPDGRTLGYLDSGDPAGRAVFFCHGTPGSRLYHHPDESIPQALGVRLIAPDRPGYGLSTFQRGRTLLDWPADLAALADHLGIGRFAVVGLSGGGPHALACALSLTSRLTHVGLVASTAPLDIPEATRGMAQSNRVALAATRALPFPVVRLLYGYMIGGQLKHPEATLDQQAQQFPASDRTVRENAAWRTMELANLREAYRQGAHGHAWEGRMLTRPWGFHLGAITLRVHLWQGEADVLVPPTMGQYLAATLPNCAATFVREAGHLALFVQHWGGILATMCAE